MNRKATRIQKRDFHFRGIQFKRLDASGYLAMAALFVFLVLTGSVEDGAIAGACFIVGWLVAKAA